MKLVNYAVLLTFVLISTGCYHALVTTGKTPSTIVIDKPFASGWIYGLVPPSTVEAASECPDGVAKVETELSFVNQLVNILTFGIYTPMHIKVTCAMPESASLMDSENSMAIPSGGDVIKHLQIAADIAVENDAPLFVQFSRP